MKILGLCGSARGERSLTLHLTKALLKGAAQAGAATELVDITKLRIEYCIGCQICYREGRCAHKDDFEPLFRKIMEADGLVLASPNYFQSVSGQMKTLIDRMSDVIHCQLFAGKYGAAVATAGGPRWAEVTGYLTQILGGYGAWVVGAAGVSASDAPATQAAAESKAAALGAELAEAIRTQRRFPEQEARLAQMRDYFKTLVERNKANWMHEAEVWARVGWK
jgi:multimeric flavodoxin WrbA